MSGTNGGFNIGKSSCTTTTISGGGSLEHDCNHTLSGVYKYAIGYLKTPDASNDSKETFKIRAYYTGKLTDDNSGTLYSSSNMSTEADWSVSNYVRVNVDKWCFRNGLGF